MPQSDFVCTVKAGGQSYTNWESVIVRRDYGKCYSYFTLTAAEPSQGTSYADLKLKPGDPVEVYLGGDKVISGNVTTRSVAYDARSHDVVIAGMSLTANMESSCKVQPGTFNGYTFEQAARGVLGPTGVGLVIKNAPAIASKPFKTLSIQHGESVFEFIERMAKFRGFFLTDDENGNLVASQIAPGAPVVAELYEGINILRAAGKLENQALFSRLDVTGQQPGDDQHWPTRDVAATVTNPNATVQRTQTIVAEHPGDAEDMQQRANFEAANSLWPCVEIQVTVVGWHKADGSLWIPTDNVQLYSPMIFPTASGGMTLGIQACIYAQDSENGTTTTLELKLQGALSALPSPDSLPSGSLQGQAAASNLVSNPNPNAATTSPPDSWSGTT